MRRKFINELLNIQHKSKSSEYELNAMQFHVLVSTNIHNQYSLPSSALTAEHMDMQRWRFRTKECNTHEGELEKANETRSHHKNLKHISVIYNAVLLSRTKVIMGSAAVAFLTLQSSSFLPVFLLLVVAQLRSNDVDLMDGSSRRESTSV